MIADTDAELARCFFRFETVSELCARSAWKEERKRELRRRKNGAGEMGDGKGEEVCMYVDSNICISI